jgi:hypothetical protein
VWGFDARLPFVWSTRNGRLTEEATFAVHLENVTAVCQSVQQYGPHAFALENLGPFAERQVACQQHTLALVAIREHLKELLGAHA